MMLVTLAQAIARLRLDPNEADDVILMIEGASGAVISYLKSVSPYVLDENGDPATGEDDNPIVRPEVQNATLLLVGYMYKDRDNDEKREYEMGYLPRPVMAQLYPLRDPAIA